MIKAGQLSKGMFIRYKDDPYLVAEREFVNPGKGSAFVRLKLKNVKTGQVRRERMFQMASPVISVPVGSCRSDTWPGVWPGG